MNERLYRWMLLYAPVWVFRFVPSTWRRRQARVFIRRVLEEHWARRQ